MPIDMVEGGCEQLVEFLAEQELDVILTILDGKESKFASRALFKTTYMLAIREDHRFANRPAVNLSDLADEPFILPERCAGRNSGPRGGANEGAFGGPALPSCLL